MEKLLIVGAGSVGKFVAYNINDFTTKYQLIGFLDDDPQKEQQIVAGFKVLGSIDRLRAYSGQKMSVVFGIAFPEIKNRILQQYQGLSFNFPSMISKRAWISPKVTLERGDIVYPGVCINYESHIGEFVVINMNCSVGHNCVVGNHSSLAPGVNLGGHTKIGNCVEMGIGSATIQNIVIGDHSIIGGQSIIIKNANPGSKIKGVPGK